MFQVCALANCLLAVHLSFENVHYQANQAPRNRTHLFWLLLCWPCLENLNVWSDIYVQYFHKLIRHAAHAPSVWPKAAS